MLGNRRERHHLPRLLPKHMAHKIILMQPLHNQYDRAARLIVEPAVQGVVVPVVDGLSARFGKRLLGFHGVVDDDVVSAPAGQYAADRSREPISLCGRLELPYSLLIWREARAK